MGRGPKPTKGKAKPAVSRQSSKSDDATICDLEKRLAEALEQLRTRDRELAEALDQQTATNEILRVISSSPSDVQPVFDVIVEQACRLCDAVVANAVRIDGDRMHNMAAFGFTPEAQAMVRRSFPQPPSRATMSGRAILERAVVEAEDASIDDVGTTSGEISRSLGGRAMISVPMLKDGIAIGAITLARREPGRFPERQVNLLRSFANQAVIAIENVRLFNETKEALEQQTATSEILRVISSSPTDLQPVFNMVVRNAATLCGAAFGGLHRVDSGSITLDAHYGVPEDELMILQHDVFPLAISRESATGRAILDRKVVHIPDIREDPAFRTPRLKTMQNYRTILAVPMMREGIPLGALALWRREVQPFSETEIDLVRTFADQAVIAIENVRLFTELEARNSDLTLALEQQTATSEILRVISSSPTDEQPVFDAIVRSARRLCEATYSGVFLAQDGQLTLAAVEGVDAAGIAAIHTAYPRPIARDTTSGRAILDRRLVHLEDSWVDPEYTHPLRNTIGLRSILTIPFFRDGIPMGALSVWRPDVRPFTDKQIALLQTFADQAVIAIENVRLFNETKEALEQQTATSEILRVISSSPTELQPVLDAVAENAARVCGANDGHVYRIEENLARRVAHYGTVRILGPADSRPLQRETVVGRAIIEGRTIHITDIIPLLDTEYPGSKPTAGATGSRTILVTPLLREGIAIGAILIRRLEVRPFTEKQVALLQTFADQAVIAIENVRLFTELQASNRELTTALDTQTATSDILRVISRSPSDVQPVFEAIVESAVRLLRGFVAAMSRIAGDRLELAAFTTTDATGDAAVRAAFPQMLDSDWPHSRVVRTRTVLNVTDAHTDAQLPEAIRSVAAVRGYHSLVVLPLLRHDEPVGAISLTRRDLGGFTDDEIALLQTFASQAVIAIENVRLFKELQTRTAESEEKSRQLEIASQHKSEFLANMSHELRTPLNAVIGFSEVLNERMFGDLNDKQADYLKDIHASGQHLLSLINDILDLSKIEAGKMDLEVSDFDLPATIDNALMLVRERAARRGIDLHKSVDERLGQIHGDERKLRQVLLNLLSNAIKFTPEGGRIEVGAKPIDGSIEVSVADTGVGIAPEDQDAVFEEFRQVGAAEKKVEGTGLGLALSRKFIELHGGKIWVNSQVGQGSTFTFTVPVRRGE